VDCTRGLCKGDKMLVRFLTKVSFYPLLFHNSFIIQLEFILLCMRFHSMKFRG